MPPAPITDHQKISVIDTVPSSPHPTALGVAIGGRGRAMKSDFDYDYEDR
jgi:hypothetical protein